MEHSIIVIALTPFCYPTIQCNSQEARLGGSASIKPGINKRFLDPELDVEECVGRFEIESRERPVALMTSVESMISRGALAPGYGLEPDAIALRLIKSTGREVYSG
ncbi:MAG: hypothetical protein AAF664_02690 [Planctomycetota bacterium]